MFQNNGNIIHMLRINIIKQHLIYVLKQNNNHNNGVVKKIIGKIKTTIRKQCYLSKIILIFQNTYIMTQIYRIIKTTQ